MVRTAVTMACFVLVLICALCLVVQRSIADESPVAISQQPNAPSDPVDEFGRLIWAMLDAIEREHFAPPSRNELLEIVVRVLTETQDGQEGKLEADVNAFVRCQNSQEFAEMFCKKWNDWQRPSALIEEVPDNHKGSLRRFRVRRYRDSSLEGRRDILTDVLKAKLGDLVLVGNIDQRVEEQFTNNRYVGLGVTLGDVTKTYGSVPSFISIVPGGPADRAGLKANTIVYEIDGRSTQGLPTKTIIDWIRGPAGSELTLTVSDPGESSRRKLTLNRGVVHFDSIFGRNHQPIKNAGLRVSGAESIGWLTLNDLTSSTVSELRSAEARARSEGIRVLVLDFRVHGRPDILHQASLIADSFLDGGTIWNSAKRGQTPVPEIADRECLFRGVPLVIIVDQQRTGPTPCAIAAALQDAGRATIVGSSPDFHGEIPITVPLKEVPYSLAMNAIKLTRTRSDRSWPLVPDCPVIQPNGQESVASLPRSAGASKTQQAHSPVWRGLLQLKPVRPLTSTLPDQLYLQEAEAFFSEWTRVSKVLQTYSSFGENKLQPQQQIELEDAELKLEKSGPAQSVRPTPSVQVENVEELALEAVALRVAKSLLNDVLSKMN